LPSPEFLFDEAARFRGYRQSEWDREPWQKKARVLAHYLEHNLRESYVMELARKDSKKKAGKDSGQPPPTNWARFRGMSSPDKGLR
jgi:hypothetical protein